MDSVRVTLSWREQVDDQHVNALAEAVDGLFDEIPEGSSAILVAGRDDFDHGNHSAQVVLDDDAVGPARVNPLCRSADNPGDGRWQSGDGAVQLFALVPFGSKLDRQDIRFLRPGPLFNERRNSPG